MTPFACHLKLRREKIKTKILFCHKNQVLTLNFSDLLTKIEIINFDLVTKIKSQFFVFNGTMAEQHIVFNIVSVSCGNRFCEKAKK